MNQADTAWMLISTALVLLMTPALAFFYGGLVRSEERPQHDDDELHLARIRRRALGGHRLLAGVRPRERLDRRHVAGRSCTASASIRAGHDSPPALHVLPGHVRIITAALISGAIVERMRFSGVRHVHHALGARRLQPDLPLGLGRRLARQDGRARLRRRHRRARERGRRGARRRDRRRQAADYPSVGTAAAQRAVHAARRRTAVVRLVRLQRRQRACGQWHRRARVHDHDARARRDARRLDAARSDPSAASRPPSAPPRPSSSASSR